MGYRLKGESFEVVDGPFAGKKYLRGVEYAEIPPTEKGRFEEVKAAKAVAKPAGKPKAEVKKKDASDGDKPATQTAGKPAGVAGSKLKIVKPDTKPAGEIKSRPAGPKSKI